MDPLPETIFCAVVGVMVVRYLWKGQVHPGWKAVLVAAYLWGLYELFVTEELYLAFKKFTVAVFLVIVMTWYDRMTA